MTRSFPHRLDDIRDALAGIEAASDGKTFADFQSDWLLRRGIERGIEIISEASRSLPNEATNLAPEIPWPSIRAIGNVLRHEYHSLSDRII